MQPRSPLRTVPTLNVRSPIRQKTTSRIPSSLTSSPRGAKTASPRGTTPTATSRSRNSTPTMTRTNTSTPTTPRGSGVIHRAQRSSVGATATASNSHDVGGGVEVPVRVVCRFRPESQQEKRLMERRSQMVGSQGQLAPFDIQFMQRSDMQGETDPNWTSVPNSLQFKCDDLRKHGYVFDFDRMFDEATSQQEMFESCGRNTCENVLKGYNGCIMCYGQTGSGKTHSMLGPHRYLESFDSNSFEEQAGLALRCASYLLDALKEQKIHQNFDSFLEDDHTGAGCNDESADFRRPKLIVSFIEIYNEKIYDLLGAPASTNSMNFAGLKEKEVYLKDDKQFGGGTTTTASSYEITTIEELIELVHDGARQRTTSTTQMNAKSSRSHALLTFTLQQMSDSDSVKTSTLTLVDLAGSEKVSKSQVTGQTLEESNRINLSLLYLGMVVRSLSSGANASSVKHIPYKNSKLTRLLVECIGGNASTCIILHCSSSSWNSEESLSTLRFGERARTIKNHTKLNVQKVDTAKINNVVRPAGYQGATNNSAVEKETQQLLQQHVQQHQEQATLLEDRAREVNDLQQAVKIHEMANSKLEKLVQSAVDERNDARDKMQESSFEYEVSLQILRGKLAEIREQTSRAKATAVHVDPSSTSQQEGARFERSITPRHTYVASASPQASPSRRDLAAQVESLREQLVVSEETNRTLSVELDSMKDYSQSQADEVDVLKCKIVSMEESNQRQVTVLEQRMAQLKQVQLDSSDECMKLKVQLSEAQMENEKLKEAIRRHERRAEHVAQQAEETETRHKSDVRKYLSIIEELQHALDTVGNLASSVPRSGSIKSRRNEDGEFVDYDEQDSHNEVPMMSALDSPAIALPQHHGDPGVICGAGVQDGNDSEEQLVHGVSVVRPLVYETQQQHHTTTPLEQDDVRDVSTPPPPPSQSPPSGTRIDFDISPRRGYPRM